MPDICIVRALSSGGPYLANDLLSIAFSHPTAGRVAPDEERDGTRDVVLRAGIPETISAAVVREAEPFKRGEFLTLSFVDPTVVRIHALRDLSLDQGNVIADDRIAVPPVPARPASAPLEDVDSHANGRMSPSHAFDRSGIWLRIIWTPERVRRFVNVSDKLFTTDRLGWYRHAFVLRLLIPDHVCCDDHDLRLAFERHLDVLRSAAAETLGRPLLAAFMPNFSIDADWLDSFDDVGAAGALAGIRDALSEAGDGVRCADRGLELESAVGRIDLSTFSEAHAAGPEVALATLIPSETRYPALSSALHEYRAALIALFSQTAHAPNVVRLKQLAHPNHALDDRLWQTLAAFGSVFAAELAP